MNVCGKLRVRNIPTKKKNAAYNILIEKFKEVDPAANKDMVVKKNQFLEDLLPERIKKVQ